MSAAGGTWIVAASIGAVETFKDQLGICRWNYSIRSLEAQAKKSLGSLAKAKFLSSSNSSVTSTMVLDKVGNVEMKESEQYAEKIMHLSCWGPNTIRF
ncbi:unnamed protein product [Dovyalis caffra]|uniref:Wound-responsive family protein n=1 Tax=Dovyalis caffra TaxID=77055 RepID=A0AAV1R3D6_9ROSI|nr:unnamed protein product [Dovyalis caffra]